MSHLGIPMQDRPSSPGSGGPHRKGGVTATVAVLAIAAVVVAVVLLVRFVFGQFNNYEDYEGEGSGSAVVVVAPGDSVTAIGRTLADADVVASPEAFVSAAKGDSRATSISPGAYQMRLQMSGSAAFALILDPSSRYESQVVLPEGLRIDQTVTRSSEATGIAAEDYWAVLRDPAAGLSLPTWASGTGVLRAEGFLFPATYAFAKDAAPLDVLQTYVDRFNESQAASGLAGAEAAVGHTPYEALIVASLVQAEGDPDDFGKVARVIYNRLDPNTWGETFGFLQLDATINYANAEAKLNLSNDQLQQDGPYNTYTRKGLPPTPINSPGDAAMTAAIDPEDGDWLYYVTVNPDTGETKFTANYNEFLAFKAEFQAWCKANSDTCGG